MRKIVLLFSLMLTLRGIAQVNIIPQPLEVKQQAGVFLLKENSTVSNSLPAHDWKLLFPYFKVL
jgi:hypothetical protein